MMYRRVRIIVSLCAVVFVLVQGTQMPEDQQIPTNTNGFAGRRLDQVGKTRIGIIISPLLKTEMIREIAMYWQISDLQKGEDKLTLYDGPPEVNSSVALYSFQPNESTGVQKTHVSEKFVATSKLTFQDQCLEYYVAWHRNNIVQKVKCLATHPNWMRQKKATLGSKRLNEIFIPGTHDSSSYNKEEQPQPDSPISKYTYTQDEDILSQLIYGARYLDIRVGRHPELSTMFWANHGPITIRPLITIIKDVKTFLENTQEIVIFDVHKFSVGFAIQTEKAHQEFIAYLEEQFAGYFLPKTNKGWSMTLNEIWATGKRLIIGYNQKDIYPQHQITWQPVHQRWPNVNTMDELFTKINKYEEDNGRMASFGSPNRPPSSVMAQLTPGVADVVLDWLGGLRKMAEKVNMNVTESYNDKWRCTANIVSMDYIRSSGIIEAALEWNDERHLVC